MKSDAEYEKLKELYRLSFEADEKDAQTVLGFARKYGEIHYLSDGDKITTMLCLCALEDGLKYLFAVATHPNYRNQGLFRKNLKQAVKNGDDIVCIPEKPSLFPLYEKLGFNKFGGVLQIKFAGNGGLLEKRTNSADMDILYKIYQSSPLYPHKTKELFFSTIQYHLLYKGTIITDGSFYALADGKNIIELCLAAGKEERLPALIEELSDGTNTVLLPAAYLPILEKNRILCERKRMFALKSDTLDANKLYINILYN